VTLLLPTLKQGRGVVAPPGLFDKFYLSLAWLQPRLLGGDRWAARIAFRLLAVSDAGFNEDLSALLASMIPRQPLLFLEELNRNRQWVPDLPFVVLNLGTDDFADASPADQRAELQSRLDSLRSLELTTVALMGLRDRCVDLLGEEIAHGLGEGVE
jgi:hypothetical protein